MGREPGLTFEGALRILGQHEHKATEKIDKLLGGLILGGGAAAGAAAPGVTPLAPLAAFGLVRGRAEQKGLAAELLKAPLMPCPGRPGFPPEVPMNGCLPARAGPPASSRAGGPARA
jgi:hypothetical protein